MSTGIEIRDDSILDMKFTEEWFSRLIHIETTILEDVTYSLGHDPATNENWRLEIARSPDRADLIAREYSLTPILDQRWADKAVACISIAARQMLVLPERAGRTLASITRDEIEPVGEFLKIAVSVSASLSQMHAAGIIHGRIQSRNIFVEPDGKVLFSCFGSSTILGHQGNFSAYAPTLSDMTYAAPEQARRDSPNADQRSDLYSLGVVLYEILTGILPLKAETMAQWLHAHVAVEPSSPSEIRIVPNVLEQIVMKLIEKDPELRYQTAYAVHADILRSQDEWSSDQQILPFSLGRADLPRMMMKSERLFGRSGELRRLAEAATRTLHSGEPEAVLISGAPGAGKSVLVERLPALLGQMSLKFATGKSDQLLKEIPFAPFSQVLLSLIVNLLSASAAAVQEASERLAKGLAGNSGLLLDLVPESEFLLTSVSRNRDASASVSQGRMTRVITQALSAFSTAESPLVLFIDDIQWADDSTVAVIRSLIEQPLPYLLLVIAYRDGEVSERLLRVFGDARSGQLPITEIILNPLATEDTADLISSMLNDIPPEEVASLAELVQKRTGGNAFYVKQFLRTLVEQSAIRFDILLQRWTVDQKQVTKGGDIVDFLSHRLQALSVKQQTILRMLALLGGQGEPNFVSRICGLDASEFELAIQPLFSSGFLLRRGTSLSISHDRVLETAYRLTGRAERPSEHSRIAKLLLQEFNDGSADRTFQIAHQIERAAGVNLSLSDADRLSFIQVLVAAARRVRSTGAARQSIEYLEIARRLAPSGWDVESRELIFDIEFLYCECLINVARLDDAMLAAKRLFGLANGKIEKANVHRLQAVVHTVRSDYQSAIDDALSGLSLLGVILQRLPSRKECDAAYELARHMLKECTLPGVTRLPEASDPEIKAAIALLSTLSSSFFVEGGLAFVHVAKIVELSLIYGVVPESAYGLAWFGVFSASRYGVYREAYEYAATAAELVLRNGFEAQRTGTLVALDQITPWTRPLQDALATAREAAKVGYAADDLGMTCYARNHIVSDLIAMGTHLTILKDEVDQGIALIREVNYQDIEFILQSQSYLVQLLLQGKYAGRQLKDQTSIKSIPTLYWTDFYEGIGAYYFDDDEAAVELLSRAMEFSWSVPAHIDFAYGHLFMALALARSAKKSGDPEAVVASLEVHRSFFLEWAELNPNTFGNKLALIEAEIAASRGDFRLAAMRYELSVNLAEAAGFVHEQALGHELAGAFYEQNGLRTAAQSHIHTAHACYSLWGAEGKAQQIQSLYAEYFSRFPSTTSTRVDSHANLDLEVVLRTSQALSEEIVLERVVGALMKDMIIHAGAQYGLLMMMHDGQPIVEASGRVVQHEVVLDIGRSLPTSQALPFWVLNAVVRKKKPMVFADAFAEAPQVRVDGPSDRVLRSVMCLPLIKRGSLVGVMYLENNLAPGVFTANRVAMLEILAPQAAISLDAARLYRELTEENQRRARTEADLMQARAELARTSQLTLMGGLAASIAHEINQPLASIVSNADASTRWLKREKPVIEEALSGLESIKDSGMRASGIVKALRSLAKQAPAATVEVDLNAVVKEVLRLTSPEIEKYAIKIVTRIGGRPSRILGDPVQLQQVILNLVTNAADALIGIQEDKRELSIEVSRRSEQILVCVQDKGKGIERETLRRIFDPFFSTKSTGMGMGLAICQSILEAHGGRLEVDSVIGEGTTFSFRLAAIEPG